MHNFSRLNLIQRFLKNPRIIQGRSGLPQAGQEALNFACIMGIGCPSSGEMFYIRGGTALDQFESGIDYPGANGIATGISFKVLNVSANSGSYCRE